MIINTAQGGGGSDLRLKVYAQPTEPAEKDGVWLKTALAEKIKKIVFDSNVWAAEQWQNPSLAADMPTARSEFCSAVFGDEIYIFGGRNTSSSAGFLSSAVAYKPSTNTYRSLADMPGVRASLFCAALGDEIFIFGGESASSKLSSAVAYKPSTGAYRGLEPLPEARSKVFGVAFGDEILIFGGEDSLNNVMSSAVAYKPSTNTYRSLASMPATRSRACGTLVGDEIFIFGGYRTNYLNSSTAYNPQTNAYRGIKPMPQSKQDAGCGLIGDTAFVFGGYGADSYSKSVNCLKLTTKQYPDLPSFIFYRLPKDTTLSASLVSGKIIDEMPVYFKDCMLFKDSDITFPELRIGDGTQWNLARSAQ